MPRSSIRKVHDLGLDLLMNMLKTGQPYQL
jgi:hypothetical protein